MTFPLTVCPETHEPSFLIPLFVKSVTHRRTQKNSKSMNVSTKWKKLTLQNKNICCFKCWSKR